MTQDDFALLALVVGASLLFAAAAAWRGKDAPSDVALLAGSGASLGACAGLLLAL